MNDYSDAYHLQDINFYEMVRGLKSFSNLNSIVDYSNVAFTNRLVFHLKTHDIILLEPVDVKEKVYVSERIELTTNAYNGSEEMICICPWYARTSTMIRESDIRLVLGKTKDEPVKICIAMSSKEDSKIEAHLIYGMLDSGQMTFEEMNTALNI